MTARCCVEILTRLYFQRTPTHSISLVRKFRVTDSIPVAVVVVNDEIVWLCDSDAAIHVINVQTAKIVAVLRGQKVTMTVVYAIHVIYCSS